MRAVDTIAAVATPPGAGALGVVRVSGPSALACGLALLRSPSGAPLPGLEPRRAARATAWAQGEPLDEVVALYFPGPRSATGEDVLELTAHGSPYILARLLRAALAAGARPADPGEFTQRAFLNGRIDLAQAEAVGALIRARGREAHRAALRALAGGLSRRVSELRAPLLELLARVEAGLDHPEEDLPPLPEGEVLASLEAARAGASELAASFARGRAAAEGARVCLIGRPNAGKSSLLNALLGFDRAIVAAEPGTTRDTLEEAAELAGLPAVLIDTAGLREECADPAEAQGLERAREALRGADLALLVIDGSRPESTEDRRVHEDLRTQAARDGRPLITVMSKADLPARAEGGEASVSALERRGVAELAALIARRAAAGPAGDGEGTIVTSLRQHAALSDAAEELEGARAAVLSWPGAWEDRAACHLRQAARLLGEVLGEGAPDEVLAAIFSKFCIGK